MDDDLGVLLTRLHNDVRLLGLKTKAHCELQPVWQQVALLQSDVDTIRSYVLARLPNLTCTQETKMILPAPIKSLTESFGNLHTSQTPSATSPGLVANRCAECGATDHVFKSCPVFAKLKKGVSLDYYTSLNRPGGLLAQDAKGFCAAGVCIVRRGREGREFLVAQERRGCKQLYNFLGGKRENLQETPMYVAEREFQEETSYVCPKFGTTKSAFPKDYPFLQGSAIKFLWCPKAKYVLYFVTIDYAPDVAPNQSWVNEVDDIVWMRLSDMKASNFHPFAWDMCARFFDMCDNFRDTTHA